MYALLIKSETSIEKSIDITSFLDFQSRDIPNHGYSTNKKYQEPHWKESFQDELAKQYKTKEYNHTRQFN